MADTIQAPTHESHEEACEWAFLSATIALQQHAKAEGGNAIVGIHSAYGNHEVRCTWEYGRGAGRIVDGRCGAARYGGETALTIDAEEI